DVEFTDRNLLANNSFLKRQTDWTFSYLYSVTLENRLGIDDLLVTTKSDSRGGLGYIEQELSFAELGFSDSTTLDRALADNAMQVKFGGWSAGDGAAIQVTFKDADGVMIGLPVIISKASTERYIWMERELTALIPEGTRSISYRVDLEASDSQSSRLDDVFLYIHDLRDSDGDGLGNSTEFLSGTNPEVADTDGDGAVDAIDVFPLNPAEWLDTDNDGIGNNADLDGDNDGVEDTVDAFPLDQTESLDTDGDGIGNNADLDDDGDGIVDVDDIEPLNDAIGDVQAPIFDVITNLEFEATGLTTAIELNIPQVSDDNLNIPTISSDYSGPLSIGEHTITWTAIDYAGNTTKAEQVISIVDTTSPVFSKMEIISITAQGVLTDISDLVSINAIDLVDGEVIASAVFSDFYYSGIHYIEFKAIDNSGNEVELEQEVHINPLINVGLNKVATSNSVSTLDVYLSGEAAKYPVTINYELSGSAIDNVTGQLIINEGISSALLIDIPVDAVTGEQAILTLLSAENAKLTDDVKVTLSVINDNYAPDVSVLTYQNNLSVQVINPHDGVVTVKAIISDINNSDTHDIQWNSEFSDIVDLSNDDLMSTFELSPQYISNGVYALTVTVKEKDTEELLSIKQTIALVVDDNLDELSLESDADKDGISDSEEGYQDSDKDGISDYLDIDIIPYRLPWSLGQLPIETVSGLRLSLGNIILPSRSVHAQYATIDFAELALFGSINFSEVDNAFDYHFEPQDKIMNFNVSGLSLAGDSIPVIVPLSYGKMIAEDAIYRIYNENNGWQDFMLDSHNSIASAKRDPIGNCPPLKSSKYSLGLASGDNCIKLVISDGGLNDSDGAVSGKVAVIGALAGELTNQLPQITIPSEYTFDEEYYVSIDASSTSDAENDELTFNWRQISGSNVEIVNASSPEVSFTTPSVSSDMAFTLELSVFDGRDSAISLISVNVQHVNKPPVVIITDHPATVNEGSSITLVSDNSDPDGDSLSYYWEQISGPTVMMSDNSSASVKFTAPEITSDSVIEVRLTSSDDVVSVSTVTKITIKNVEPTHEEKNESSDSGGSMGWTLILLGLIASRRINK
ncbi:PKD domain-containing protein, partial [Shewanella sp. 0m-8]